MHPSDYDWELIAEALMSGDESMVAWAMDEITDAAKNGDLEDRVRASMMLGMARVLTRHLHNAEG